MKIIFPFLTLSAAEMCRHLQIRVCVLSREHEKQQTERHQDGLETQPVHTLTVVHTHTHTHIRLMIFWPNPIPTHHRNMCDTLD